ncbi:hypothetical protein [Pseudomonas sivasensis]|uniref:hypothetical protein n=1 Tax=Pseudomonas sivasensis TaxID=1880678 RepID=UPI0030DDB9C6
MDEIEKETKTAHVCRGVAWGEVVERTKTGADRLVLWNAPAMPPLKIVGEYAERQKKAKPQGLETPFIFLPSWTPEPPNSNVTCKGINRGAAPKVLNTRRPLPYNCRHTYATMRAKFQHTSPFFCSATGFRALMSLLMHA